MSEWPADPVGAAWLARNHEIWPIGRLPVLSQIGKRRATMIEEGFRLETYPETMRPASRPEAHLQFHLRHEVPHLEFLARLFAYSGPAFVQAWVDAEPTGQYARRAAFLYEWLTGDELQVPARLGGNYVDAIDATKLVAASPEQVIKVQRWRVNDNLPGTPWFCPIVVRTDAVLQAIDVDVRQLFAALAAEFGEDLLMRAATWMTLRESRASFAIEGEIEQKNRIQRFADVIARHTGQGEVPLGDEALARLQREILGRTMIERFGIRQSPVFVGEHVRYEEVVHYVAPMPDEVAPMLEGLRVFLQKTQGQSSVMRSAVTAFGFVYIHPLADGNGRVHRFLINDVLRRDGVLPAPVILPVSTLITDDVHERRNYDRILDRVSGPLMQAVREFVGFDSVQTRYPDAVVSNLTFSRADLARPVWRYPDLGPHVVYLSDLIRRTVNEQMRQESRYLRAHARARSALKEIVEMPDQQADRVLRCIEQNRGKLSRVLARQMPVLESPGVWAAIVEAVLQARRDEAASEHDARP